MRNYLVSFHSVNKDLKQRGYGMTFVNANDPLSVDDVSMIQAMLLRENPDSQALTILSILALDDQVWPDVPTVLPMPHPIDFDLLQDQKMHLGQLAYGLAWDTPGLVHEEDELAEGLLEFLDQTLDLAERCHMWNYSDWKKKRGIPEDR